MEIGYEGAKESQTIKRLLGSIEAAAESMSVGVEETVARHEEEFVKCYKVKISELVRLFEQLKSTIEDKFVGNTLALQLDTVLKERDYFKYECLKLNAQHQTLLDDHKNLAAQANNSAQQITIYKHLLQTQKIRSNEIQVNLDRFKRNLTDLAGPPEPRPLPEPKPYEIDREIARLRRQLREKNEAIRALRERVQELERVVTTEHSSRVEKKELYELFRTCVEGWRRQGRGKGRKEGKITPEQLSALDKKQLLRVLFTHGEFLRFLQRLLFDEGLKVTFQCAQENYLQRNRSRLLQVMSQHKIYTSPRGLRL